MARNVLRGGGKAVRESVIGLKELERKLRAMSPDHPEMRKQLQAIVSAAAGEMRDEMRTQARSAGWGGQNLRTKQGIVTGQEAINSIFSYGRPKETGRAKVSGLAGVSKQRTMVEWTAGRRPRSPRAKVAPGRKVAMAFATMLEFGTSRMSARPAIRTAVKTARTRIIDRVTNGFQAVYQRFAA